MAHKIKLTYFDGPGRAEAIRLALFVGGLPFEDERLTPAQFQEQKAAGRFKNGQVPVLEVDGVQHAQSLALLMYAGKLTGLYPSDPIEALKVDECLLNFDDAAASAMAAIFAKDDAARAEALKAALAGPLPQWLNRINAAAHPSGYLVGEKLTIADLKALSFYSYLDPVKLPGLPANFLQGYPNLAKNAALVASHPKIAEWRAKHNAPKTFPKLKLTYFESSKAGRGEAVRLAFHIGGVPFEDERLSFAQFAEAKQAGRFKNGSVPVLEIDGVQHAQSNSLLLFAGSLGGRGLVPTDSLQALKVTEALNNIEDMVSPLLSTFAEPDEAKRVATQTALTAADGHVSKWLTKFEALLGASTSGFLVGNSLTVADLKLWVAVNTIVLTAWLPGVPANLYDAFPNIAAYRARIEAVPEVASYYTKSS